MSKRVNNQNVRVGEAFELHGARARQEQIERTLDRLKKDRIKQAELECQKIIEKAQNEARDIIAAAQEKAAQIVAEGEGQRDAILEKGYQEGEQKGFAKGYADGQQEASEQTRMMLEGAQTMVEGAYEAQLRVLKNFRRDAAGLVSHITHKILHDELDESPDKILTLIDSAIDTLNLTGSIRAAVSTDTLRKLREFNDQTRQALEQLQRFELVADPQLDVYEVYILSAEGNYYISPDVQAEKLIAPLENNLDMPMITPDDVNADLDHVPPRRPDQDPSAEKSIPEDSEDGPDDDIMLQADDEDIVDLLDPDNTGLTGPKKPDENPRNSDNPENPR